MHERATVADPVRVAESVAAELRERILTNRIPDGPLPKQEVLTEEFGVSGPSIREALRILDAEGLITVRRGKVGGAVVHRPSAATASFALALAMQGQSVELRDLADSVLDFEPACVASCARRTDRAATVIPMLEANIAQSEALIDQGDEFTRVSRQFHLILVDHASNSATRLLIHSLVSVWSVQEEAWASTAVDRGTYPERATRVAVIRSHRKLVSLVRAGDAEAAASHHRRHLRAAQRLILRTHAGAVVDASSPLAVRGFRALKGSRQAPTKSQSRSGVDEPR